MLVVREDGGNSCRAFYRKQFAPSGLIQPRGVVWVGKSPTRLTEIQQDRGVMSDRKVVGTSYRSLTISLLARVHGVYCTPFGVTLVIAESIA